MTPLKNHLQEIIAKLIDLNKKGMDIRKFVTLTTLVNAAVQLNDPTLKKSIRVLRSLGTDLFSSFERSRKTFGITSTPTHTGPPLIGLVGRLPKEITFDETPHLPGPQTVTVAYLREPEYLGQKLANDFSVGAVGLPPGLIHYPLLWGGILCHEIGGHYILGADEKLLPELQRKVYTALSRKYSEPRLSLLAPLWRYWTEEAASDVRGVFLLGPSFGFGTIAVYTALFPLWFKSNGEFSTRYDEKNWHPLSILIPDLICGALEQLQDLSESIRGRYIAQIAEIAQRYSEKTTEVQFENGAFVRDPSNANDENKYTTLSGSIPLREMRESARFVGGYIATVKLDALNGHCLRDLGSWSNDHEDMALAVGEQKPTAPKHLANRPSKRHTPPTPMQLIAGSMLAAVHQPNRHDDLNKALFEAFNLM